MSEIILGHVENPAQRQIRAQVEKHRFSVNILHRGAGKTTQSLIEAISAALFSPTPNPRSAYVSELLIMSRRNAWDYAKRYASVVPDWKPNETFMTIDFPNGGRLSLFGADNPDALRGLHHDFVVLDEFALMDPRTWPEVVLPTLLARNGKALIMGTPLSRHDPLWTMYQKAATLEGWGRLLIPASQSGILSPDQLAAARAVMTPEQYAREMECQPSEAVDGSIYGKLLDTLEREGRLTEVEWDPNLPSVSAWDIGVADATSIVIAQRRDFSWAVIDYLESSGVGLDWYVKQLREMPYTFSQHIGPHDLAVQEFGSGQTRLETARALGVDFTLAPRLSVEEGIDQVRRTLPQVWIDRGNCERLWQALQAYRYEWNDGLRTFSRKPVHDWSSHACDALRVLFTGYRDERDDQRPRQTHARMSWDPFGALGGRGGHW